MLHKDVHKQFTAKVHVFSDSVLCHSGKCPQQSESARVWEQDLISCFVSTPEHRELYNLDGEPFVVKWKVFLGHTKMQLLYEIQKLMEKELRIQPQSLEDRIIFMSKNIDIDWTAKNNTDLINSFRTCREIPHGTLDFPGTWRRSEMVWDAYPQTQWRLESNQRRK